MAVRYDDIGNRLKAFRLGSRLSADEIARQTGISRTALYRFEKGEVVKIETLDRLASLLQVSVATLLGVGIEYIASAVSYFERMRQIESTAQHVRRPCREPGHRWSVPKKSGIPFRAGPGAPATPAGISPDGSAMVARRSRASRISRPSSSCRSRTRALPPHILAHVRTHSSFLPAEFIARLFATVNPCPISRPPGTWPRPWTRRSSGSSTASAISTPSNSGPCALLHAGAEEGPQANQRPLEDHRQSGMFKAAFAERRCLVPAPAYYEWRGDPDGKTPFAVARSTAIPSCSAASGKNEIPDGEIIQTFATITTDANRQLAEIQDRCR